jgi:tRNA(fMet)-specific endonuclease VapC
MAARLAGQIYGVLEQTGKGIGWADCLIAGVALAQGRVLVTGNVRHFMRITAAGYPLEIVNWREVDAGL